MKSRAFIIASLLFFGAVIKTNAQTIEFGSLNGYNSAETPTFIVEANPNDLLGTSLLGVSLWALCLEMDATFPNTDAGSLWEYSLSTDSSNITSGAWATMPGEARISILNGISNMFFNNQLAIYTEENKEVAGNNDPGKALQHAAWAMIHLYGDAWDGALNEAAVESMLEVNSGYAGTLVETYLYSGLIPHEVLNGRVIFGAPAGATPDEFQPIMFFIPEPSGAILLGVSGICMLMRRKRTIPTHAFPADQPR